jgi:hypothetical protein
MPAWKQVVVVLSVLVLVGWGLIIAAGLGWAWYEIARGHALNGAGSYHPLSRWIAYGFPLAGIGAAAYLTKLHHKSKEEV